MKAVVSNLFWYGDFAGHELSYPEINVIGLYYSESLDCKFYIDTDTGEIIQVIIDSEEI